MSNHGSSDNGLPGNNQNIHNNNPNILPGHRDR